MQDTPKSIKLLILWTFSVLFSSFFVVFTSVPLWVLKRNIKLTINYIGIGFLITILFFVFNFYYQGLCFFTFFMLTLGWDYFKIKTQPFDWLFRGFFSVIFTLSFSGIISAFVNKFFGYSIISDIDNKIEVFVSKLNEINSNLVIEKQEVFHQIPSLIIVILIFSLILAIISERKVNFLLGFSKGYSIFNMSNFKLPDVFLWIFMVSFLVSFMNFNIAWLGVLGRNLMNILAALYFIQGFSIIIDFFSYYRISPLWQFLLYVIIIGQLMLFVPVIGIIDFWIDFRVRFRKNKKNQKDNIKKETIIYKKDNEKKDNEKKDGENNKHKQYNERHNESNDNTKNDERN